MIHCGSKRIGQAGAAMADHSSKSCKPDEEYTSKCTKEQTGRSWRRWTNRRRTPVLQAKTMWDNLKKKKKYKDCKYPGSGEGVRAATWPWFVLMDEVLGQRSSTTPPVLIASIPEDTPGRSGAVGNQMEKEDSEPAGRGQKRKMDKVGGVDQGRHEGTENGQTVFQRMAPK
ncbi:hypothetical protein CHARACLAT_032942 [Characodon lateralis]|uniref:Uncharacterized protein n=1 Tax=Characodon lateralis TaxID=208331 RepID=A0ABU7F916_9TELE|nr:hypothetical protein [Characodon lateralis]